MKAIVGKLLNDIFLASVVAFAIFSLAELWQPGIMTAVINPNILLATAIASFIMQELLCQSSQK